MTNKKKTEEQGFHFEAAMNQIESIVKILEENKTNDIDSLLHYFEEGSDLIKKCYDYLEHAETRIHSITKNTQSEKRDDES